MMARRYVVWRARYWLDTGLRDYRGWLLLSSLTRKGEGATAAPEQVRAAEPTQLAACVRVWGEL